jgi:predicted RNase H-like HicB family nuclease
MKLYHVAIEQEDGWFIGRVLERIGITTQGRSLDELVFMVRDAIKLMWNETDVQLELIVPSDTVTCCAQIPKARRRSTFEIGLPGRTLPRLCKSLPSSLAPSRPRLPMP